MRKSYLAGAAGALMVLLPAPAFAADLSKGPVHKAPPPATTFSWTGFYVGGHVGYGWSSNSVFTNL